MSAARTAECWTCDGCGVSVRRIDGARTALPDAWASSGAGRFCLLCRRTQAAEEAIASAPAETPVSARAKIRRAALIEFEVRRTPELADNMIARACRATAPAVAQARERLHLPEAPRAKAAAR